MSLRFGERNGARRLRVTLPPVVPQDTARRTYRAMLTDQVTPVLEDWGFESDGERFTYPSTVWHLGVGFAPMAWSTVTAHRFDVLVFAVPREAWTQWRVREPALPDSPDPTVYYAQDASAPGGLTARLGELDAGRADARWTVHAGVDPTPVAVTVLTALRRHVLPAFAGRSEIARAAV
ncbi:hypothetical protein [Demequina activiva]|uniref:Uncharacterized protein n=1 Tax=Demequina activiva TaxID=1582364 RepID=A0A919UGE3_9MICO|nr:hypothetical protein [Demequina activiva]GIG54747.1 hypothetical protein Dac01nite_14990 [Demequina activiva]